MAWGDFLTNDTVLYWSTIRSEFDPTNMGLPITLGMWIRWQVDHPQAWGQMFGLYGVDNGNNVDIMILNSNVTDNYHQTFAQGPADVGGAAGVTQEFNQQWFYWAGRFDYDLSGASDFSQRLRQNGTSYSGGQSGPCTDWRMGHRQISIGGRYTGVSQQNAVICHCAVWNSILTDQNIDDLGDGGSPLSIGSNLLYYYPLTSQTDFTDLAGNGADLAWQSGAATWYDDNPVGPVITDFGDENHQWGETGLVITGTNFGT